MKARNELGQIVQYRNGLPIHYSSETLGTPLVDFNTMSEEVHKAEGFFDVVVPEEYDPFMQYLGAIYFDETKNVFTYPVETLEVPIERPIIPVRYKNILTKYEFKTRFTSSERIAIRTVAKTDAEVEDLWDLLESTMEPDLDDPTMIYGVSLLEQIGLIGQGRANEILTKYPI